METEECMFKNAEGETWEEQNQNAMLWKEREFQGKAAGKCSALVSEFTVRTDCPPANELAICHRKQL